LKFFSVALAHNLRSMARLISSPWPSTHVGSTREAEFDRLISDTLGRRDAQSFSEKLTIEPVRQKVEVHCSTFNYIGNPPHRISSDAARWCAQNRSAVPLSEAVPVPAPAVVPPMTPAPTTFHGGSLARRDNELPAICKINCKPKIDGNFFKSMAKSIKASRASIADESCTQHTGYYTSNSCSENTLFQH
jgi:hypothetical protein